MFSLTQLWAVYVSIIFVAIGYAINVSSWKILFYSSVNDDQRGKTVGIYETLMQIVFGVASILTGIVGDIFGFEWIMILAGVVTIFSGILPLLVRKHIR